jgi:hypothetical protein
MIAACGHRNKSTGDDPFPARLKNRVLGRCRSACSWRAQRKKICRPVAKSLRPRPAGAVSSRFRALPRRPFLPGNGSAVSFASLRGSEVEAVIDRLASSDDVTLLVGAGASIEAFMPSRGELLRRLDRANDQPRRAPGAGAVVEVLTGNDLTPSCPRRCTDRRARGVRARSHRAGRGPTAAAGRSEAGATHHELRDLLERALQARGGGSGILDHLVA